MSRIVYDDTHWPLCLLVLEGPQTLEQHMDVLDIWNQWFARGERFVALRVHLDDEALELAAGTGKASTQWLKAGAATSIRELVAAMVIVTPPTSFDRFRNLSVEAVFGVPGAIFSGIDDALSWLPGSTPLILPNPADVKSTIMLLSGKA